MFHIGELIMYGNTGVCRVEELFTADGGRADYLEKGSRYYCLKPLYQTETIFTPVENSKVYMRPIISADEAERLIDTIPDIQVESLDSSSPQELKQYYQTAAKSHDCADLIALTMSIYAKRQSAELKKKKFGLVDERYMKQAEDMLHGEFSAALGIPRESVGSYIAERVAALA